MKWHNLVSPLRSPGQTVCAYLSMCLCQGVKKLLDINVKNANCVYLYIVREVYNTCRKYLLTLILMLVPWLTWYPLIGSLLMSTQF